MLYIDSWDDKEQKMTDPFSRELMRGSLDLMVLSVLAEGSQYGYRIQKRIREASSQQVSLPAGTLYPLLHRLEEDKLIRSRWETDGGRRRKWYELTASGERRLARQAQQWQSYAECIRQLLAPIQLPGWKPA